MLWTPRSKPRAATRHTNNSIFHSIPPFSSAPLPPPSLPVTPPPAPLHLPKKVTVHYKECQVKETRMYYIVLVMCTYMVKMR